jgi:ketosteroid isomerase-like protein
MKKTDSELIQQLLDSYARALDAKDYEGVGRCFTADAVVAYPRLSQPLRGRSNITTYTRRALEGLDGTQHLFTDFKIAVRGNSGRVSCGIFAQLVRRSTIRGDGNFLAAGQYEVGLRRAAGKWKISRMVSIPVWSEGIEALPPKGARAAVGARRGSSLYC